MAEPFEGLPARKRHRRFQGNRATIQGLVGDIDHDIQMQHALATSSAMQGTGGRLAMQTWSGPQGAWSGPQPGMQGNTSGAPTMASTGETAPALDILAHLKDIIVSRT